MMGFISSAILVEIVKQKEYQEWFATLPEEEQAVLKAEHRVHRMALEIADAGRALNFWGD